MKHNTSSVCLCHQTIPFDGLAIINDCIIGWLRLTSLINNYTTTTYTESHPNNRCIWSISCGLFYGILHRSLKRIIIVHNRIIFISHRPLIICCLQTYNTAVGHVKVVSYVTMVKPQCYVITKVTLIVFIIKLMFDVIYNWKYPLPLVALK